MRILDGGSSYVRLQYCPWCGVALSTSLRDRWFDELDARGIDPDVDEVPLEFTDSRWYRDKGF